MTSSQRRQIEEWVREARRQGWDVERGAARTGHWKWRRPDGSLVATTPSTPGGGNRSLANVRAKLRRAGLDIR